MKLDENTVRKLEEAFAIDASVSEACFFANISRDTYYRWVKENQELSDRFEALRNKPILKARKAVVDKLDESYQNAMDYLKRKRKKEFGDNLDVTSEHKQLPIYGGHSIQGYPSDQKDIQPEEKNPGSGGGNIGQ